MNTFAPRILVVDDEAIPRILLRTNLAEAGCVVQETDSGRKALQLLRDEAFDVVLLDLIMPEMDGFQVLKEMKEDNLLRNIPVVVVSGSDDMNSVVRCLEMGALDHLSKPFDPILLNTRIRSVLALRQAESERLSAEASGEFKLKSSPVERELPEDVGMGENKGIFGFLRSIVSWGRPYRRNIAMFVALVLIALGIEASLPMGFKFIIDNALIPHDLRTLIIIFAVLIIALITAALTQVYSDRLYVRVATNILNDLRFNMYRHLQRLSMGFFARVPAGTITARFTTDLSAVENTVMLSLPLALSQFMLVVFSLCLLLIIEWKLALFSVIGLAIGFRAERLIEGPAAKADAKMKESQAAITSVLQETVSAQSVIKVFRLQNTVIERFKHQMVQFYRTAARACFLSCLTERIPGKCISLFGLVTIAAGAFLTFYGFLTVGELISFQVLLAGMITAVGDLAWSIPHLVRAAGGMYKIEDLLNEKPHVTDDEHAVQLPRPEHDITFKNVTFGYTEGQTNLNNVSLTIPIQQSVLLVGPSGCGKSTILNLLMRFYDPAQGSVAIDGYDLRRVTRDSLRQHISMVLQENFLFNTTIRENIRMGKKGATDEEVEAAAKAAGIHDIIIGLPEGYDKIVGERGTKLSGGQRQRLAIARAILSDPPILLLDEATSALDPTSADHINKSLEAIQKGRTVISVTHRLESAPKADIIFVFQEGRLVESGPHEELLKKKGLYSQLWHKQTGFVLHEGAHTEVTPERLRAIPILSSLDEESLKVVGEILITEHFPQDRWVFHEEDPGDKFFVIVRGRVGVFRRTTDGNENRIAVLEDGDYFGENALIRNVPRNAGIRTLSDCIILSLAREQFIRLIDRNPKMREEIERTLSQRLGVSNVNATR